MNSSLMSKWYLKTILIVLVIITIYLVVKSYREGFEEGLVFKGQGEGKRGKGFLLEDC